MLTSARNKTRIASKIKIVDFIIDKPILVVEDDEFYAQSIVALLRDQWSCEVHIANNYAEAKNYLKQYRFDYHVAICDLGLPDAPDGEIVDLINKAKLDFIILSGLFDPLMRNQSVEKGAIDFIDKTNPNALFYVTELAGRLYKNRQIKILVVDDAKSARLVVKQMLEVQNYQVLEAENGVQALEILQQHDDIKVILTDYAMPVMDGFELVVKVREQYSKEFLAIIGISGVNKPELSSNFIKNGANDFLVKPFSYNELLCRVNQNVEMLEYMEFIHNQANRDYMTKIYNRRYFFTEGKKIYEDAKESNSPLAICMMDIDHFKKVNDSYGHECGDVILIHFAKTLNEHFKQHLVARLGGEEFAVLFENTEFEQVLALLNEFREAIEAYTVSCEPQQISITVSIGVNNNYEENIDVMLKVADEKLYLAKEGGRNQVVS